MTSLATSRIQAEFDLIEIKAKKQIGPLTSSIFQSAKASIKENLLDFCNTSCQENGVSNRVLCS